MQIDKNAIKMIACEIVINASRNSRSAQTQDDARLKPTVINCRESIPHRNGEREVADFFQGKLKIND